VVCWVPQFKYEISRQNCIYRNA